MRSGACHSLLLLVEFDQFFSAYPKNAPLMSASRSMPIEMARRKSRLLNHSYLMGSTNGSPIRFPCVGFAAPTGGCALFRLNHIMCVPCDAPTSYKVKLAFSWFS